MLGRLVPGPLNTTHYDPYHSAGLIVWQDPFNYLRLERAIGFIDGRHHASVNYELRAGGLLAVSRGFTVQEGSHFLKHRRQGESFSAWYSHDRHRWIKLGRFDAAFPQRVEVGVVAVDSSTRMLSAELEMLNVEDPQGSMARDFADPDTEGPPPASPASREGPRVRPRRAAPRG